jgi:8-oxo-dGTP diphosphatase
MIYVSCAIIEHHGKVLVAKRGNNSSNAGKWEFPGGKIEPGESATQCLHREIMEELSVAITIIDQLPPVLHHYPDKVISLHPFVCTYDGNPFSLTDHEETDWKSIDDLFWLNFSDADVLVCHYYIKKYLPTKKGGGKHIKSE